MNKRERELRQRIAVRHLYEVYCDEEACNGNADEGEILDSYEEARHAREAHIKLHLEGHFEEQA